MEYLIPSEWFAGAPTLVLIPILAAATYALIKGADWLVEGASGIALRLGMSKVIVGATIVSLGTTSPECAVSVMAAFRGDAGLALGNAVGSIIADTGLIFGIGCLLMALPTDRFILNRQGWVQFGAGVLLGVICYGAWLVMGEQAAVGRPAGWLLVALLGWYLWASVKWGRRHAEIAGRHAHAEPDQIVDEAGNVPFYKLIAWFALGLVFVIVFGHVLIEVVKVLALRWGVPQVVVASTIVAFGTSLPELVVGITAIRKGHPALLIGNVIGADILNVLFVTGVAATAKPLPIIETGAHGQAVPLPEIFLVLHLPVMLAILAMFRVFTFMAIRRGHFARWMGVPLVGLYLAYLVLNYALAR